MPWPTQRARRRRAEMPMLPRLHVKSFTTSRTPRSHPACSQKMKMVHRTRFQSSTNSSTWSMQRVLLMRRRPMALVRQVSTARSSEEAMGRLRMIRATAATSPSARGSSPPPSTARLSTGPTSPSASGSSPRPSTAGLTGRVSTCRRGPNSFECGGVLACTSSSAMRPSFAYLRLRVTRCMRRWPSRIISSATSRSTAGSRRRRRRAAPRSSARGRRATSFASRAAISSPSMPSPCCGPTRVSAHRPRRTSPASRVATRCRLYASRL